MYVYALNAICTPLTRNPSFQASPNAPRIIDPYSNAKCNLKANPGSKPKAKHPRYYPNLYERICHVSSYIIICLVDRHVCVFD
jgi:hypothetical protein